MRTISATELKAKCYTLLNEAERTGTPILVTKDGDPYMVIRPLEDAEQTGEERD